MNQPRLSLPEAAAARERYRAATERVAPELSAPALRVLDRISPPNWALEWSLPGWLGTAIGLAPAGSTDLTLANVFGLAYIRLQDDLADGEVVEGDRVEAMLLSTVLYQQWTAVYARLFDREAPFWAYFERYMAQWVRATWRSHQPPARPFRMYDEADLRGLGERGAPLKICGAAAFLLAGRGGLLPQLEAALDHLLTGAVLLDHALDWTEDLAAGRYNAFVAYASPLAQVREHMEANRQAVWQELMVGRAARPYFALVRREFQAAGDAARAIGVSPLDDYVAWLQNQAHAYGRRLAEDARARLHGLTKQVLLPAAALNTSVTT